jgi:hypothetical protein
MTQRDRDRLVVLKKAQKKLITQAQAAQEIKQTTRQVRRLLKRLAKQGDAAILHGLRGRPSNRRIGQQMRDQIVEILSQPVYRGFGPTLASEYLRRQHQVQIGRETLRQMMIGAGLWRARRQRLDRVHQWRARRSCPGELVQWDTSEHDWLEGRGPKLYLIHMIDDATSRLTARFVAHDSTEENLRLLWTYLEHHGRPVAFYTDKASLFRTAPKITRDCQPLPREERDAMPPTQIGRALNELGIVWIAAHSPQAKGRVERSFGTAQDRLVKGLRVAGACTLEQANRYLEQEFLPWWNQHLAVAPANPADAHRPLGQEHDLGAILSQVESRCVRNDYTIQFDNRGYQIERQSICAGLRGASVEVERRLDGTLAIRFRRQYLSFRACAEAPQPASPAPHSPAVPATSRARKRKPPSPTPALRAAISALFKRPSPPLWKAAKIDRTRTPDTFD